MRDVYVAGIGSTSFGKHVATPIESLAVEAAARALVESGIDRDDIGALYLGNFISGPLNGKEVLAGIVGERLGLQNIPCTKVEGACASGGIAFRHAWIAVASGMCDAAIVVGVEKMTHASTAEVTSALNCAMDNENDGPSGLTFPGLFGLAWRVHAKAYGTTRDDVSAVVIKNKANGLKNPLAQMGSVLTPQQIRDSAMIADPLQMFDCCPASDGAAAIVLTSADLLRPGDHARVRVLASVQTSGSPRIANHPDLCSFEATVTAARKAYEQSGLVPRGQGGKWASEGRTQVDGTIAINPSGGLLSKGHPVGATGVGQVYEAVRQLRGEHPNQVANARVAMTHNLGGTGVACTVTILGRDA